MSSIQTEHCRIIADLHLSEDRPQVTRAFFHWLKDCPSEVNTLFILGDFFEYWVGDDIENPLAESVASALLSWANTNRQIYFLPGNRDFAIETRYLKKAGMKAIEDEQLVLSGAKRIRLSHGDIYCTSDVAYQRFRKVIRQPWLLALLRQLPKNARIGLAEKLRAQSKARFQRNYQPIDVTEEAIVDCFNRLACDYLIHGHTHLPDIHYYNLNEDLKQRRVVVGDWHDYGWFVEIISGETRLHRFPIKSA